MRSSGAPWGALSRRVRLRAARQGLALIKPGTVPASRRLGRIVLAQGRGDGSQCGASAGTARVREAILKPAAMSHILDISQKWNDVTHCVTPRLRRSSCFAIVSRNSAALGLELGLNGITLFSRSEFAVNR